VSIVDDCNSVPTFYGRILEERLKIPDSIDSNHALFGPLNRDVRVLFRDYPAAHVAGAIRIFAWLNAIQQAGKLHRYQFFADAVRPREKVGMGGPSLSYGPLKQRQIVFMSNKEGHVRDRKRL
jgi:hypothetical protein